CWNAGPGQRYIRPRGLFRFNPAKQHDGPCAAQTVERRRLGRTMMHDGQLDGRRERRWLEIKGKIEQQAHLLAKQGSITRRQVAGRPNWTLRFVDRSTGCHVQRAIYLGADAEILRRVRHLLASYRAHVTCGQEASAYAKLIRLSGSILRQLFG